MAGSLSCAWQASLSTPLTAEEILFLAHAPQRVWCGMGKRDSKAAKAKRAERRGKGALKTEEKTAKGEQKQKRRDANRQDDEDLEKARRSLLHLGG